MVFHFFPSVFFFAGTAGLSSFFWILIGKKIQVPDLVETLQQLQVFEEFAILQYFLLLFSQRLLPFSARLPLGSLQASSGGRSADINAKSSMAGFTDVLPCSFEPSSAGVIFSIASKFSSKSRLLITAISWSRLEVLGDRKIVHIVVGNRRVSSDVCRKIPATRSAASAPTAASCHGRRTRTSETSSCSSLYRRAAAIFRLLQFLLEARGKILRRLDFVVERRQDLDPFGRTQPGSAGSAGSEMQAHGPRLIAAHPAV